MVVFSIKCTFFFFNSFMTFDASTFESESPRPKRATVFRSWCSQVRLNINENWWASTHARVLLSVLVEQPQDSPNLSVLLQWSSICPDWKLLWTPKPHCKPLVIYPGQENLALRVIDFNMFLCPGGGALCYSLYCSILGLKKPCTTVACPRWLMELGRQKHHGTTRSSQIAVWNEKR